MTSPFGFPPHPASGTTASKAMTPLVFKPLPGGVMTDPKAKSAEAQPPASIGELATEAGGNSSSPTPPPCTLEQKSSRRRLQLLSNPALHMRIVRARGAMQRSSDRYKALMIEQSRRFNLH